MTEPIFDKVEQFEKVQGELLPGETIEAVFDLKGAQTGFLGITSHRLVLYDKAFLRKIKALVSIPYKSIISVGAEDSSGLLTGRGFFSSSRLIVMTAHGEHDMEFRGVEKAHAAHGAIIGHVLGIY